jgi:hypothetical protein
MSRQAEKLACGLPDVISFLRFSWEEILRQTRDITPTVNPTAQLATSRLQCFLTKGGWSTGTLRGF